MKPVKISLILILAPVMLVFLSTCKKSETDVYNHIGQHQFWSSAKNIQYPIYMTIKNAWGRERNGINSSDIISGVLQVAPGCTAGKPGESTVTIRDTEGNYTFTAHDLNNKHTWSGSFTIYAGGCHNEELQGKWELLVGSWIKLQNGAVPNSAGVVISWDGKTGTVTANPNNSCYSIGGDVWQNMDTAQHTISYFNCTNSTYVTSGPIEIGYDNDDHNIITIDGVRYQKE